MWLILYSIVFLIFWLISCLFQPFNNWMDGAKEDLMDMFRVHKMEEIQVTNSHLSPCSYSMRVLSKFVSKEEL